MIRFHNIRKRYSNGQDALDGVDFHIDRGEMVFLTGHSGAGKSTLMKLIMLMERPTQGEIIVAGRNVNTLKNHKIAHYRRNIGVVFQNHQLLFDRNVFHNVALPLHVAGHQTSDIGRRVRAALDKVGLLHKELHNPIALSGGEQQRVGIARAIVNKPALLLADEPTGNLDPDLSAEIMMLFRQFNELGMTIVIASHDLDLIGRMNKRVLSLSQGRVVHDGALT